MRALFLFLSCLFLYAKGQAQDLSRSIPTQVGSWISLYSGAEQGFSQADRQKVMDVLVAFQAPFYIDSGGQIMVPIHQRASLQTLLQQAYFLAR